MPACKLAHVHGLFAPLPVGPPISGRSGELDIYIRHAKVHCIATRVSTALVASRQRTGRAQADRFGLEIIK
jgi:hypothetical protein